MQQKPLSPEFAKIGARKNFSALSACSAVKIYSVRLNRGVAMASVTTANIDR